MRERENEKLGMKENENYPQRIENSNYVTEFDNTFRLEQN